MACIVLILIVHVCSKVMGELESCSGEYRNDLMNVSTLPDRGMQG